jgi:hypothetical protein
MRGPLGCCMSRRVALSCDQLFALPVRAKALSEGCGASRQEKEQKQVKQHSRGRDHVKALAIRQPEKGTNLSKNSY